MMLTFSIFQESSRELEHVIDWLNDKSHMKYSGQIALTHTIDSQIKYLKDMKENGNLVYLAHLDSVPCGTFSIIQHKLVKVSEIGVLVSPTFKGMGIGKLLFKTAIDIAESELRSRKVRAGCSEDNKAMITIFLKYELEFEARLKEESIVDGKFRDILLHSKFI